MPSAISLFSGAGGLDLGFERMGFDTVYAIDSNPDAAMTWRLNRPNARAMHVGNVDDNLDEICAHENVAVVYGGPPCQGFSVAGKMSASDPRNKLVDTFLSIIERVKPDVFVIENVKALAVSARWHAVREKIEDVAKRNHYDLSIRVYDVSDYGVCEKRERLLAVGIAQGRGSAREFEEALASRSEEPGSLRNVLASVGVYGTEDNPATCTAKITVAKKPVVRGNAYSGMLVNGAGRPVRLDGKAPTLTASMGGNNTPIVDQEALESPEKSNWFEDLYRCIQREEDCSDIEVPPRMRRLTVNEAAAIQSFPRGYNFAGSTCSQYRQIGNAVPPRFAEHVAGAIKQVCFSGGAED